MANNCDQNRPEEISLSYNGGKDCLVLLILILACWPASIQQPSSSSVSTTKQPPTLPLPKLQCIYIAPPDPFREVEDFVATTTDEYHLDLARYALPMRQALDIYLEEKPKVKAVFMGTRRTDPHSEFLTSFTPTDKGWPQFMRINPVLDWHYVEIWSVSFCHSLPKDGATYGRRIAKPLGGKLANNVCHTVHPPTRHPLLLPLLPRFLLPRRYKRHAAQPCIGTRCRGQKVSAGVRIDEG